LDDWVYKGQLVLSDLTICATPQRALQNLMKFVK